MNTVRGFLSLAALLALVACGGGGSGSATPGAGSGSGSGGGSETSAARATFNKSSLSLTTVNSGSGSGARDTIDFSFSNFNGTLWYRYRQTTPLVKDISVTHSDATGAGVVSIQMFEGERLGAGTYSTTVTLELCTDQPCTNLFTGTPFQITINYEVTGAAQPKPTVSWASSQPFGALEYDTGSTQAPTFEIRGNVGNYPLLVPLYVGRTSSQTGLVTAVENLPPVVAGSQPYLAFNVTLKPPASLGSGIFKDKITFRMCLDTACNNELPGSPFDVNVVVTVLASEGVRIQRSSVAPTFGAQAIAWSSATGRLYVTNPNALPLQAAGQSQVLAIDPATLQTTGSTTLNSGTLTLLVAAGDGSGLFAASAASPSIQRLALPGLANDYSLALEPSTFRFNHYAESVLPLAGQPRSALVSVHYPETGPLLAVYDGTSMRPVTVAGDSQGERATVVAGATADTFYAARNTSFFGSTGWLDRLSVNANGVTRVSSIAVPYRVNRLRFANGLLYDDGAHAIDPATGNILRSLSLPEGFILQDFVLDGPRNRLFARVVRSGAFDRPYVMSFALDALQLLAIARLFNPGEYTLGGVLGPHMILWGNDGLAVTDGERLVVLSGPFFTTYTGAP